MAKQFAHIVTVRSKGKKPFSFPIDMLRYDGLHPRTEQDSGKIMRTIGCYGVPTTDKLEDIQLARNAEKSWTPQAARWDSFVYMVVSHEILP